MRVMTRVSLPWTRISPNFHRSASTIGACPVVSDGNAERIRARVLARRDPHRHRRAGTVIQELGLRLDDVLGPAAQLVVEPRGRDLKVCTPIKG